MACDLGVAGCPATDARPRHRHPCADLNQIGEDCAACQVSQWVIWFGHPLPALIRCANCDRGFNVSQRLRDSTQPHSRGIRF